MEIYKKRDCFVLELDTFELLDCIKGLESFLEQIKQKIPTATLLAPKWQDDVKRIEKLIEQLNSNILQ